MTQLKAGHIVRLPESGLGSSGLALVTKARAKAVTVTTGSLELTYEPGQVTRVGMVKIGTKALRDGRFGRVWVYIVGEKPQRIEVEFRDPEADFRKTVGEIRKLAFAKWVEAQL